MNKTQIEYCDFTWNVVTGCLGPKGDGTRCPYCYAQRLANGRLGHLYLSNLNVAPGCDSSDPFAPRFWPERLSEPIQVKKPSKIFAVDMGDLFGPWLPEEWIWNVLAAAEQAREHTFLLLTKQPQHAADSFRWGIPPNCWVGVTVEDKSTQRVDRLVHLENIPARIRYVSYEPLLGPIPWIPDYVDWVIIGAMTGKGAVKPHRQWVAGLISLADRAGIPVFLKDNLEWESVRQEYPRI